MGRTTGLTDQQKAFVAEYGVDMNAHLAAVRAGYSARSAASQGPRLLQNAEVKAAVDAMRAARSIRTGVSQDRVLRELARLAFADPRSLMTWGPDGVQLRDSVLLSDDDAAAVAEVSWKVVRTQTTREDDVTIREDTLSASLKLHDKPAALKLLMAHLGMNAPAKVQLSGTDKDGKSVPLTVLDLLRSAAPSTPESP